MTRLYDWYFRQPWYIEGPFPWKPLLAVVVFVLIVIALASWAF